MIHVYADAEDRLNWDKDKWIDAFDLVGKRLGYTDGEKATAKYYSDPLMEGVSAGMPDV